MMDNKKLGTYSQIPSLTSNPDSSDTIFYSFLF